MSSDVVLTGPMRGPLRKRESSLWEREQDDWYVEPRWCSARLFDEERFRGGICDPACGGGNIVLSAMEAGMPAIGMDVVERTSEFSPFLKDWMTYDGDEFDNIVSNPPFKLCDDRKAKRHPFVEKCLAKARFKVALLLPANWVQGDARSRWLEKTPLYRVWFISPRPSMPPGHVVAAGTKPGNGTTDYAWFVWLQGFEGRPEIRWLRKSS